MAMKETPFVPASSGSMPPPAANDQAGMTKPNGSPAEKGGPEALSRASFTLEDKYLKREGSVALNGIQALVRAPIDQHLRDREAGLRTGTYVTGYQGSPLGELDKQMRLALPLLKEHHTVFEAGINEDVAATAIYGSQLLELFPHSKYDGVLGMWYGKNPGLDRSCDAMRHGQFIGTGKHGGGLMLCGDDPSCKSSTIPSDSTTTLYDLYFPALFPSNPLEVLRYALHGFALSRYCGLYAAMKIVTNVADGGAVFEVWPEMHNYRLPALEIDGVPFEKKLNPQLIPPNTLDMERQIFYERTLAALAYVRENKLDRITVQGANDRIGLLASGKSYDDLMLALQMLGFAGEDDLKAAGIRIYKPALITPLEPQSLYEFARGLHDVVVVEEKRGFVELQVRDLLYNLNDRPRVYGKKGVDGETMFTIYSELQPDQIAFQLAPYLAERLGKPELETRMVDYRQIRDRQYADVMARTPYFCSGCPHNTSTTLPEGALAGGGIGCHAMASYMDRGITYLPHMGGEGAAWMGLAPFTDMPHFFQNVGDGTYFHSASKALEACIASGHNMTFKILYNAAVAMTGGQKVTGVLGVSELARKLELEGAQRVVIVPEDMGQYRQRRPSEKITVRPKAEYQQVMQELQAVKGTTVIIFDQQCAAEKRRHRKRGTLATPKRRVIINQGVCEGCGDCGVQSNCLSVIPVDTDYGRKTMIHQSSCNYDYSCLKGDCPSFMTVELGPHTKLKPKVGVAVDLDDELPEPAIKADAATRPYCILMVGIGGTGVVTTDALLVTAAAMENKHVAHLDQTGLAQKGGAVVSNFVVSERPLQRPNRIGLGEADVLLAFDLLASVAPENLSRCDAEKTIPLVNTHRTNTAAAITDVTVQFPQEKRLLDRLYRFSNAEGAVEVDAEQVTEALFGSNQTNNVFMLGVAYQSGLIPLQAASIEQAIRLNNVAVEQNIQSFRWGRRFRHEREVVQRLIDGEKEVDVVQQARKKLERYAPRAVAAFDGLIASMPRHGKLEHILPPRLADLILYQSTRYAQRYHQAITQLAESERQRCAGRSLFAEHAARQLFKLMAYKDEYEVARLWLQDPTEAEAMEAYDGPLTVYYHLHPPILRALGMQRKLRLGPWFKPVFRLLYRMKGLRGTWFDAFGRAAVRREERQLVKEYRTLLERVSGKLTHENHPIACQIAAVPDAIRGYEEIKAKNIVTARSQWTELLQNLERPVEERLVS